MSRVLQSGRGKGGQNVYKSRCVLHLGLLNKQVNLAGELAQTCSKGICVDRLTRRRTHGLNSNIDLSR
jgi:hypothetical protein